MNPNLREKRVSVRGRLAPGGMTGGGKGGRSDDFLAEGKKTEELFTGWGWDGVCLLVFSSTKPASRLR